MTTQINELKNEKQCNQQIVQDYKRKFNNKLLEKDEESSLRGISIRSYLTNKNVKRCEAREHTTRKQRWQVKCVKSM